MVPYLNGVILGAGGQRVAVWGPVKRIDLVHVSRQRVHSLLGLSFAIPHWRLCMY